MVGEFFTSLPKAGPIPVDRSSPLFRFACNFLCNSPILGSLLAYASHLCHKVPEEGKVSIEELVKYFCQGDVDMSRDAIENRCRISFHLGYATRAAQQRAILDKLPELPLG